MSYKMLFCLGITTLLTLSFIPAAAARGRTVSFDESKPSNFALANEETKSSGVPQGSSRPPRG